jgi:hypothetical protein
VSDESILKLAPVTILPVVTSLNIPVERVLTGAQAAGLKYVMVIGRDQDGELYFAASESDGGTALWEMETVRLKLMGR